MSHSSARQLCTNSKLARSSSLAPKPCVLRKRLPKTALEILCAPANLAARTSNRRGLGRDSRASASNHTAKRVLACLAANVWGCAVALSEAAKCAGADSQ